MKTAENIILEYFGMTKEITKEDCTRTMRMDTVLKVMNIAMDLAYNQGFEDGNQRDIDTFKK